MSNILSESAVGAPFPASGMYLLTHFGGHSFQLKQYAPIEIVKTEMKGFGLRAAQDIQKYVR